MFYKILEKYSQLKSVHSLVQEDDNKKILSIDEELLKKFLELYDKDVKAIHTNQELIEKDLQFLYKEVEKLTSTTKHAVNIYDNFLEYLKEAGDLYNWCGIIEKEMGEINEIISSRHNAINSHIKQENTDI